MPTVCWRRGRSGTGPCTWAPRRSSPWPARWAARGAIVTLANVEPERCVAAFAGDAAAQLELAPHHRAAGVRLPVGIKELTRRRFGTSTVVRVG